MNFELTEDQREIKRTARDWLAARYPIARVREIALDGAADDTWDEVVELGWPEITDFGMVELAVVAEELGASLAPTPLASHWAARLLHPELEGRGTVAMWDEGGTDPAASTMDGPAGTKIAVPAAEGADVFIVTASGGRHFAVPSSAATVEPARALDPTRPLSTVTFDGAGEELSGDHFGRAWHAIAVAAAAESVGVAARVTAMSVQYAKERKQFDRPIGSYQAVSHACAQMFLETEGARNVVLWAAWALDHDPDAAFMAANSAKAYASDAAVNVCRSALQVHGGIGFTWEHDLHLFLKRAEANARAFGDSTWHREQVAAAHL
ncbi:acyl-CoA/acyl-ACP dehydrogenase [Solirubrobacter sp. CPCC 204708]|uniref:Acyl-CoA/acyl-ACP dehydrogenase n=1 Tax=Solirubrobacter deserti TaxID=2282478 RepID=A0ABT4RI06_9ACTN|nr:acyl-CoA dehydrogenase family protein [Solirubrobacter deserti]MBE2318801.1 acyl-CoA/acyl-ACP dehydrogenase [Solirubrobacter deserti]MDA0138181.1 acyl-CoA/acyl-ACP dehydrogenase [Solirubrobacter deserti]